MGAHLILRRRIFLGLTLPQIAACGVAFTFWIYHELGLAHGAGGERLLAMAGSLLWTFIGMGLLAYLDRHAAGSPEGRLAAAYALASALTILFVVFNPAGELEILNLLKGEVIALSKSELKLLAIVYGIVLVGLMLFRREFLLTSFDPDLAFLLTAGKVQWSVLLYLLCGLSIAVGVIMAGPLLVFGFMVLPPLCGAPLCAWNSFLLRPFIVDRSVHGDFRLLFVDRFGSAVGADRCRLRLRAAFCQPCPQSCAVAAHGGGCYSVCCLRLFECELRSNSTACCAVVFGSRSEWTQQFGLRRSETPPTRNCACRARIHFARWVKWRAKCHPITGPR